MKYLGNKTRLLNFIEKSLTKENISYNGIRVLDLFAGTGSVSLFFKQNNCHVDSVDFMKYSVAHMYAFNYFNKKPTFDELKDLFGIVTYEELINFLFTNVNDDETYYFDNYCPDGNCGRQYFTNENGHTIDRILNNLLLFKDYLPYQKYMFLSGVIMNSIDRISNIAGTYGTYLKIWRSMALKKLEIIDPTFINCGQNDIYQDDVCNFVSNTDVCYDIIYLDPPYNERQYAPNFHVLENIVNNDRPELKGKSGLIDYSEQYSLFCLKRKVENEFDRLITCIKKAKYIVMSYSTEGLLSMESIVNILKKKGTVTIHKQKYRRFKTNENTDANTGLEELLFICKVDN